MKQYVNLHGHSYGSLLDGMSRPEEYVQRVKELGMPASVITDHGNVHTLMDFYEASANIGLKHMPGLEAYQARKTRFDRDPDEMSGRARSEWDQRGPYHLTVLAYNNVGYRNLLKLSSRAFTEGYLARKPRIDHELLSEHSEGLVVLSGCLSGEVIQALLRNDFQFALAAASKMQEIVGKDNYFIEIMDHYIEEERRVHEDLKKIAKMIGAKMVATCDCHYTHKHQAHSHDLSLCVSTKSKFADENRFRFSGDHFYLKSYEEMAELFPEEYLDNTMLIYDKYDLDINYNEYHFPVFETPNGMDQEAYFIQAVYKGADKRYGVKWRDDKRIKDAIEFELNVIRQLGFANYFLVVGDIVQWAKSKDIMVGAGRGSAAGSVVSYCLYITEVDPIKYNLSFDRFLVYQPPSYELEFPEVA